MSGSGLVAIIGGTAWDNWTEFEVEADVLTPAAAFSLTLGAATPSQVAAVQEGTALTLMMGRVTLLTGWIDRKRLASSHSAGSVLTLEGRDHLAPVVDCSAPVEWSWTNLSLTALAQRILQNLGVTARVVADADANTTIASIQTDPGESCWDLLTRYVRRQRLLAWSEPGILRIGRPTYTGTPVGELRHLLDPTTRNHTNVLESSHAWRTSARRSPVTVLGQAAGSDTLFGSSVAHIRAQATDEALVAEGLFRPLILTDGSVDTYRSALDRARWEVGRRAGEGWVGMYGLRSHGPTPETVWEINTLVDVVDEAANIRGPRWIASRTLRKSRRQGATSHLVLRDLNAILPPT